MIDIARKAFVAAQVHLRECNEQIHRLNDVDELNDNDMYDEYARDEATSLRSAIERLYSTML